MQPRQHIGQAPFGRARGADARPAARFEPYCAEREHDGWDIPIEQSLLRTEVAEERARSIITRNRSPDVPFDRSVNPYRGCEHGCIYCFARPSHAYWDMSPGLDFETKLIAKTNAADVLEQQLSKPGYVCAPINLGSNTDPYQPIEREYKITRQTLEVLLRYRHPVTIITTYQAFGWEDGILVARIAGAFVIANLLGWLFSRLF